MNRRNFLSAALAVIASPLALFKRSPKEIVFGTGKRRKVVYFVDAGWQHLSMEHADHPEWKSYTDRYTTLSKEEALEKLSKAMGKMNWCPPQ